MAKPNPKMLQAPRPGNMLERVILSTGLADRLVGTGDDENWNPHRVVDEPEIRVQHWRATGVEDPIKVQKQEKGIQ